MKKSIDPESEWGILKKEIFNNRLQETPYPSELIKKRELLLFAETFLAKYQSAESPKYRSFFRDLYGSTMKAYFAW